MKKLLSAWLAFMLLVAPIRAQDELDAVTEPPPPVVAPPAAPLPQGEPAIPGAKLNFDLPNPDQVLDSPINFSYGTPVSAVLDYYAQLTGRSIISAPTVQGTIVFRSQGNLTVREAIFALDTVLAINGIAVLPIGEKFLKVVQIANAKQEGPPIVSADRTLGDADTLVTQIVSLQYADATEIVAALQPYLHPYGHLLPLLKSNSVLITDTAANIRKMLEIVGYVDKPSLLRMETRVFVLTNARAAEVVQQLQAIIQETQQMGAQASAPAGQPGRVLPRPVRPGAPNQPGAAPSTASATGEAESVIEGKVIITSDERTNKIFVLSRPSNFDFFERLIDELDSKIDPDVITKVIELDYANAEDMAGLLNSLISGSALPARRTPTRPGTPGSPTPPPAPIVSPAVAAGTEASGLFEYAEGVRVLPDPRTNSLLLMATKNDMDRIDSLIRTMDTDVAQVLIEVVIAEVNLKGSLEVGVEVFKRLFQEGQVVSGGGTDTIDDGPSPINLTDSALPLASALGSGGLTYFLSLKNMKLDAVVRLMGSSSKFKVLSTPMLQTQHNQEASIIVGESRPVVTSTVSDIASSDSTAVRSNIEFRDIAIELKVTPRINPDGFVTMEIEQKINDVGGTVIVNGIEVPIITKREARATVAVKDQSTIVLGGLIREDKNVAETKVPFLGDIPVLGHLFKSKSNNKNRTELIVFIRPIVLRGDASAMAEAKRRSEMLKAGEELDLKRMFEGKASATDESFTIKEMQLERLEQIRDEEQEEVKPTDE